MVDVAQWQSAGLWNRRLRVRPPSSTLLCKETCPGQVSCFPQVIATGQLLETPAAIWSEATPAERKELLGFVEANIAASSSPATHSSFPNLPEMAISIQLVEERIRQAYSA